MGVHNGPRIGNLVKSYQGQIWDLENEIVDAFRPKIEELKDNMIDEIKEELSQKGFKIYIQWVKKYESFWNLTDFSLDEYFLAKNDGNWFFIRFYKSSIFINGKEFRKFGTIDMEKVRNTISSGVLEKIGHTYDEETDQIKLVNKTKCAHYRVYETHRYRDYSRIYKLESLLGNQE